MLQHSDPLCGPPLGLFLQIHVTPTFSFFKHQQHRFLPGFCPARWWPNCFATSPCSRQPFFFSMDKHHKYISVRWQPKDFYHTLGNQHIVEELELKKGFLNLLFDLIKPSPNKVWTHTTNLKLSTLQSQDTPQHSRQLSPQWHLQVFTKSKQKDSSLLLPN